MQDDLADGARWLVTQGIADPARICVVGGSYGGYSGLMGAVKDPELYRCVVSFAGPTDLQDLIQHTQGYADLAHSVERELGASWNDRERLRMTSPVLRAAEIRAPALLIHGKKDRVVPVEQSRGMVAALQRARHLQTQYIELPEGDHTPSGQDDRTRVLREMEALLEKHLGGS